jgi:hypothetical protein
MRIKEENTCKASNKHSSSLALKMRRYSANIRSSLFLSFSFYIEISFALKRVI